MRDAMIRLALGEAADPGHAAAAAATAQALHRLFLQLDPLIGAQAVHALYNRSLHLAAAGLERSPGLSERSYDMAIADLQRQLREREPDAGRATGLALLGAFTSLLASLVGEPITFRVMHSAWDDPAETRATKEIPQ